MAVQDLYRELVLAHNRAPRRFGELSSHTHSGSGSNPMCGDALRVMLNLQQDRIGDLRFAGEGCAISIAAASMLGELAVGASAQTLAALRADFERMLAGEPADPLLGDLCALAELSRHPARQRCALLAFDAVQSALDAQPARVESAGPDAAHRGGSGG